MVFLFFLFLFLFAPFYKRTHLFLKTRVANSNEIGDFHRKSDKIREFHRIRCANEVNNTSESSLPHKRKNTHDKR